MKILIIDDDSYSWSYRNLIDDFLEAGDEVECCCDYFTERKFRTFYFEIYDVIILDLFMPLHNFSEHINYPGLVVLDEIRKTANTPVVLYSLCHKDKELCDYMNKVKNVRYCNKQRFMLSDFVEYIHTT